MTPQWQAAKELMRRRRGEVLLGASSALQTRRFPEGAAVGSCTHTQELGVSAVEAIPTTVLLGFQHSFRSLRKFLFSLRSSEL